MKKAAVVYWSGTGNTEQMARAVAEGINAAGGESTLLTASEFEPGMMSDYDAFAFGCPSMGAEQLEESEFEPMFNRIEPMLSGRKIVLFGSYGWGDGEWMRNWRAMCEQDEAELASEPVICNDAPDDETLAKCRSLGEALT